MQSVGEILGVTARTGYLLRGPYDGRDAALLLPGGVWPSSLCVGLTGTGQHYVHEGTMPGTYVWAGRCTERGRTAGASPLEDSNRDSFG